MPDTTNRPTPEQIADQYLSNTGHLLLDALAEYGYVIVHPDDVPTENDGGDHDWTWNGCRAHIFGDDQ